MTKDVNMGSAPVQKKRKIASLDQHKARAGWIFILPFILGFVLVYLPMIWESLLLTFQDVSYSPEYAKTWVGFQNYSYALGSYTSGGETFVQVLVEGLTQLAFDIPAILIFSLFMAVMLNQKAAGRGFFRAVFFIPVVISVGVMDGGISSGLGGDTYDDGSEEAAEAENTLVSSMDLQMLFSNMKIGAGLVSYVIDIINNIFNVVNSSGVQMLIFLAGLQSISPAIYESCKIDGATAWETFWKITFPMISPMILVNGVYTIIDSFTKSGNVVMSYITDVQLANISEAGGVEGVGAAMSWMYFMVVILIVGLLASILSAFVFYQRKND